MSPFITVAVLWVLSGEVQPAQNAAAVQAAPAPTARAATEAGRLPPPEDVVEYSNRTDPEGPGQGELHLQRLRPELTEAVETATLRPDLMPAALLRIAGQTAQWGDVVRMRLTRDASGQCRVPLRFRVVNGGLLSSGPTRHVLRRRTALDSPAATGDHPQVMLQAALAAGASQAFETELAVVNGSVWIELALDAGNLVAESNEGNNVRRVQLLGECP
ncbi:MAG: hypothetical protein ACOVKS_00155 [Aquimonas sp.]|jgi:hypothetical protein